MFKKLLLAIFISTNVFAVPTLLKKDQPSPYTGYLFSEEEELSLRKSLIELNTYKLNEPLYLSQIKLYQSNQELLSEQVGIWKTQAIDLSKQVASMNDNSFWKSLLYFGLGAACTTVIVYGVNKAMK